MNFNFKINNINCKMNYSWANVLNCKIESPEDILEKFDDNEDKKYSYDKPLSHRIQQYGHDIIDFIEPKPKILNNSRIISIFTNFKKYLRRSIKKKGFKKLCRVKPLI